MNKYTILLRKEILNEELVRPNWLINNTREAKKLWLDKNECVNPILNKLLFDLLSKIHPDSVYSYPELEPLYQKIANFAEVKSNNVLITNGSDGAIRTCFESLIIPGDKVIITKPTCYLN